MIDVTQGERALFIGEKLFKSYLSAEDRKIGEVIFTKWLSSPDGLHAVELAMIERGYCYHLYYTIESGCWFFAFGDYSEILDPIKAEAILGACYMALTGEA